MKKVIQLSVSFFSGLSFVLLSLFSNAQAYQVENVVYNGSFDKFINLVFISDGFPEKELSNFTSYSESFGNNMLNESPFKEYKNYFNLIVIKVPSAEIGSDHPHTASDCPALSEHPILNTNTFFDVSFDSYNIHRLLVAKDVSAVNNVVSSNFPLYDQKIILANTNFYGGSGGENTVASLDTQANELVLHESGHTFGHLSDEYWAGEQYAYENVNMSKESNPNLVRWRNWIGVEGVGVYAYGSSGVQAQWYHPHQNCKMQFLGMKFCPVCREALTLQILQKFGSPVKSSFPAESKLVIGTEPIKLKLELYKPSPNTLKTLWLLNDVQIAHNKDSLVLNSSQLNNGMNTLQVQVLDTTSLIRDETHPRLNTHTVSWTIEKPGTGIPQQQFMPGLVIYPNPFTNEFTIDDGVNSDDKSYEILNASGQVLQQGKFRDKTTVVTRDFASGVYLVRIMAYRKVAYRTIVKK
jgi:hypothetical protein